MKKLKLNVDMLSVESFDAGEVEASVGTVHGRELAPTPPYFTCPPLTRLTDCPCTPAV